MSDDKNTEIKEISQLISKDFALQGLTAVMHTGDCRNLEEFKIYLTNKIVELMDKNYDLFFKALYRIDIAEEKLQKLFAVGNKDFVPAALADLIIERQLQKVEFRKKYRKGEL